jgi:hypothetical protein
MAAAFFDDDVSTRYVPLPEDFLSAVGKIGPMFRGGLRVGWNNPCDYTLTLAQFHSLTGAQQLFQAPSVTQLPNIYGWHISYCGTLCVTSQASSPRKLQSLSPDKNRGQPM